MIETFQQINGNKANSVTFDIQNKAVSFKDIRVQYGQNYEYQEPMNGEKKQVAMAYTDMM